MIVCQVRRRSRGELRNTRKIGLDGIVVPLISIPRGEYVVHRCRVFVAAPIIRLARCPICVGDWLAAGPNPCTLRVDVVKPDPKVLIDPIFRL